MDLKTALENIKVTSAKIASEEILCIREHRNEAIPTLLEYVKVVTEGKNDLPDNYNAHFYAMFLLAEFRVKSAFQYLIQYLEFDEEYTDWILGDALTEDFGAILASVATISDIPKIKAVIENEDLDKFNRDTALNALVIMYVEGIYQRKDLFDYLGYLLEKFRDEPLLNAFVVCTCSDVNASEHFGYIMQLFEEDLIDKSIVNLKGFLKETAGVNADTALAKLQKNRLKVFVKDAIESLSSWACFKEPQIQPQPTKKKTGRNEPCPCGSGKKYKKCCGK